MTTLPPEELQDVLSSPLSERQDFIIAGEYDPITTIFTFTRGNYATISVPLSFFHPSPLAPLNLPNLP